MKIKQHKLEMGFLVKITLLISKSGLERLDMIHFIRFNLNCGRRKEKAR